MVQKEITNLLHETGKIFHFTANQQDFTKANLAITEKEFLLFNEVIERLEKHNPWFTEKNTRLALEGISSWLHYNLLESWAARYPISKNKKRVAIIMAGNIPLVGFHDFLCVLISGHHAVCKFSSQDSSLWFAVLELMKTIDPRISDHFTISSGKLTDFEAVIATGSNNTAISFRHYFEQYPHIIRQNRTSVAVLTGEETDEELQKLADDIFSYFGFGCRNVTQLFIPKSFDVQRLFANFMNYGEWINHHKYMNNFDYYRALYLLNQEEFLENGFILMRFNQNLHAPPAVLNCHKYDSAEEVELFLEEKKEEIQVVIGSSGISFGQSQRPKLTDYADGVDVMAFLSKI